MQIGRIAQIPVRLHWSFVAIVLFMLLSRLDQLVFGVMTMGLLFGSVVLHEVGHALAARRFDISTRSITLYPFGGVAMLEREAQGPWQEFVISIAGPAVNVVLLSFFSSLFILGFEEVAIWGAGINLIMALFNLIPAFPMDGGRILRAILTPALGFLKASEVAIRVGTVFAWAFIVFSVPLGSMSLMLVGGFLHFALWGERARLKMARAQSDQHQPSSGLPPRGPGAYQVKWRLNQ